MKFMQLRLPEELNKRLKIYVIEAGHGSKEVATEYILDKFLEEYFKNERVYEHKTIKR